VFTQRVVPLRYTPRKIEIHPESNNLVILEKDHNCMPSSEREKVKQRIYELTGDEEYLNMDDARIGYPKAGQDKFASCIRIVDPFTLETVEVLEFENEVVFSIFITTTLGAPGDTYLIVGVGMDVKL
jgi:splicing factor 3B subunit 3